MKKYDVMVVGGGAAGLSGALALARARRSVLVVDDGTPRNAPAEGVHNYLTRDGHPAGRAVRDRPRRRSPGTAVRSSTGTGDSGPTGDDGCSQVELADGTTYQRGGCW